MKFEEVLVYLRNGGKIKRDGWCNNQYICIDESEGCFSEENGKEYILDYLEIINGNDWELCEEKKEGEKAVSSFFERLKEIEEKIYCMDREYDDRLSRIEALLSL